MRVSATILGFLAATSMTLSPAFAQGHGAKSARPPASVKPTTSGKPVATMTTTRSTGTPTTRGKPVATTTRSTGKPTTRGKPVATTTRNTGKPITIGSSSSSTSRHAGSRSTTAVSRSTATSLNPIAAKIAAKPNLSAKLTGLLPIDPLTGRTMTLDRASIGFKNQGQFIAALHVSQNLGIPFTELKSHMVTVTPGAPGQPPTATQTGSLGRAIQASKATTSLTTQLERAEAQALADLRSATSTPSSTTSGSALQKNTTPKKTTTTGRGR